jgi:hypothetical protein
MDSDDVQTGHHDELSLPIEVIKRIEIIKGRSVKMLQAL